MSQKKLAPFFQINSQNLEDDNLSVNLCWAQISKVMSSQPSISPWKNV